MIHRAIGLVLFLVLFLVCLSGCQDRSYTMRTSAMEPSFAPGQELIFDPHAFDRESPQRWDVVTFNHPVRGGIYADRIVGLPGETIDIRSGKVVINGVAVTAPDIRLTYSSQSAPAIHYPYRIPSNSYFLLSDNPSTMEDSRWIGAVSRGSILGKIVERK